MERIFWRLRCPALSVMRARAHVQKNTNSWGDSAMKRACRAASMLRVDSGAVNERPRPARQPENSLTRPVTALYSYRSLQ